MFVGRRDALGCPAARSCGRLRRGSRVSGSGAVCEPAVPGMAGRFFSSGGSGAYGCGRRRREDGVPGGGTADEARLSRSGIRLLAGLGGTALRVYAIGDRRRRGSRIRRNRTVCKAAFPGIGACFFLISRNDALGSRSVYSHRRLRYGAIGEAGFFGIRGRFLIGRRNAPGSHAARNCGRLRHGSRVLRSGAICEAGFLGIRGRLFIGMDAVISRRRLRGGSGAV